MEKASIRSSRPQIDFSKEFTPKPREIFSPKAAKLEPLTARDFVKSPKA